MRKRVATLCLIFAILSFGQKLIDDYNLSVEIQEQDRKAAADNVHFSFSLCSFGIDYAARNRTLIFFLSIGAFVVTFFERRKIASLSLSLFAYLLIALLGFQWIFFTIDILTINESYRNDLPFLSRIASNFDWLMFAGIAVAIVVNSVQLLRAKEVPCQRLWNEIIG